MQVVSSADFQRHFGRYQDEALTNPIAVSRNGRERIVVLSADEYQRLRRRAREVLPAHALSEDDIEAIGKTDMDPRHAHLDRELP